MGRAPGAVRTSQLFGCRVTRLVLPRGIGGPRPMLGEADQSKGSEQRSHLVSRSDVPDFRTMACSQDRGRQLVGEALWLVQGAACGQRSQRRVQKPSSGRRDAQAGMPKRRELKRVGRRTRLGDGLPTACATVHKITRFTAVWVMALLQTFGGAGPHSGNGPKTPDPCG